jgi:hypothetical protein
VSDDGICQDYISEVIESFRLGREGQGSAVLTKLIDEFIPRMEQYAAELTENDVALFDTMFTAQQRGDYLFVADILEYLLPTSTLGKIVRT